MSEYEASKTAYNTAEAAAGAAQQANDDITEINGTLAEHSTTISETKNLVQSINDGYVRWDATNNKMVQVINPDGTQEITSDFLEGWMQFGYNNNDKPTLSIGDNSGMTVEVLPDRLSFYENGTEVAYISGKKLYITQSVVLQQMDVGEKAALNGLGQWSWRIHPVTINGTTRNNLYLKWLG